MPTTSLSALNAVSAVLPLGTAQHSCEISGGFVGTIQLQRRIRPGTGPGTDWRPIAADMAGNFVQFTVPTGQFPAYGLSNEPEAELRGVMIAYLSGTAIVRLGQ